MKDKAIEMLKKGGGSPAFALGPVVGGKGAELILEKELVIYYTFENGKLSGQEIGDRNLFSSIYLGLDNNLNKAVYNKKAQVILSQAKNDEKAPPSIELFRQTINEILSQNK